MNASSLIFAIRRSLSAEQTSSRLRATTIGATSLSLVIALTACNEYSNYGKGPEKRTDPLHVTTEPSKQVVAKNSDDASIAGGTERQDGALRTGGASAPGRLAEGKAAAGGVPNDVTGEPAPLPLPVTTVPGRTTDPGRQVALADAVDQAAASSREEVLGNVQREVARQPEVRRPAGSYEEQRMRHRTANEAKRKAKKMGDVARLESAPRSAPALMQFAHQPPPGIPRAPTEALDRENYHHFDDNPVKLAAQHPVSTFSIDVDTGGYANVRRFINEGRLPPHDAVRVEEMINYFDYAYAAPEDRGRPFSVTTTLTQAPWSTGRHLLRVGVQGYEVEPANMPSANLVFLVDVSGSMRHPNKIGLLKSGLKLLARQLRAQDRISLVVYAGGSGVVLPPTAGNQYHQIERALDSLRAGGSTNGAAGIKLAYEMARQGFIQGGINRVLLATDGDFNVGVTNMQTLKNLVSRQRESGISLTTLGFGTGNYNESMMEQLADIGNGNYAYVDSLKEANKVLVQQMSGTLNTIAKDVKIQIEFNPALVSEYRLIGYENRALRREDFNNDKVDAGEIGAGHNVTALYELTLAGSGTPHMPGLRYGASKPVAETAVASELAHLRIRYKAPGGNTSQLLQWPLQRHAVEQPLASVDPDFRFAAAVAGFGQLLRGGKHIGQFNYDDVMTLAQQGRGTDLLGYRAEFVQLVSLAKSIHGRVAYSTGTVLRTADR